MDEFIKTPMSHITLGRLCWDEKGQPALSVKRGKKNEYETVPLVRLIAILSEAQEHMIAQCDKSSSE